MLRAIERGLTLNDFENLTVGMILGFITTFNNDHLDDEEDEEKEDKVIMASQEHFDRW